VRIESNLSWIVRAAEICRPVYQRPDLFRSAYSTMPFRGETSRSAPQTPRTSSAALAGSAHPEAHFFAYRSGKIDDALDEFEECVRADKVYGIERIGVFLYLLHLLLFLFLLKPF